jgi:hypothetical protein
MKRMVGSFLVLFLGIFAAGCAPATHRVLVDGYTGSAAPAEITPGGSFFVIENKEAKNPLLEKEIRGKINQLLQNQGYELAPFEKADYYLFYSYGIGPGQSVTTVMPDFGWGFGFGTGYPFGYSLLWPGFAPYSSYRETIYDKWLLINVIAGKPYREKGKFNTLWVGEARARGPSMDLRTVVNYLLLADFHEFGKNTGKGARVEIREDDLRLKKLETIH